MRWLYGFLNGESEDPTIQLCPRIVDRFLVTSEQTRRISEAGGQVSNPFAHGWDPISIDGYWLVLGECWRRD
ncbi:hypothetical protein MKW98_022749 [Papaver atlanticum]|uniref:Uncharacterized protein n=1 Tax=Papaver atlanticum TaxID=357466 RepID=A0AAD4XZP7_9MAGN|nr:hypothetical protein MKW98_022749 [Papaver atlanticum]